MQEKEIYTELEVDGYADKDSMDTIALFLESLKLMADSLNMSSEIAPGGGAQFSWKLKLTAKGEWS